MVVAIELEVQSQVEMEDGQDVGCHWGVPGDLNLNLKPHNLPRPVWTCGLQLPPIFAVYALGLCAPLMFDVPPLPHPVEAVVEPGAHSSMQPTVGSISDLAVELQPVFPLASVLAVVVPMEEEDWEMAAEEDWIAHLLMAEGVQEDGQLLSQVTEGVLP